MADRRRRGPRLSYRDQTDYTHQGRGGVSVSRLCLARDELRRDHRRGQRPAGPHL